MKSIRFLSLLLLLNLFAAGGYAVDQPVKKEIVVSGVVTDTQKQPVAGVVVTDGVNFTQTDDKGRYQLVSDPAQSKFVYLSVPADYKTNVENALPVGYYARIDAKKKKNRCDFSLVKREQPVQDFTFIAISDPQARNEEQLDRFASETVVDLKETLKQLSSQEVYGMVLGDIVWDVMPLYDSYKKVISDLDLTMYHVIGNHDFDQQYTALSLAMNKEEYDNFYEALVSAERAPVHDFDVMNPKVYEGCMPIEVMAQRGHDTIRFGPMKPVGLKDPRTGHRPWAVVQLRKENSAGIMYNLVGFQTNLKFPEQKRVFSMIPGLENAEFVRYGVMHRNTYINSPRILNSDYSVRENKNLFFAGQITGVEGYMESASSGLMAGINAAMRYIGEQTVTLPEYTMIGSLSRYISDETVSKFQPMGANLGVLPELEQRPRDKKERAKAYSDRSFAKLTEFINSRGL